MNAKVLGLAGIMLLAAGSAQAMVKVTNLSDQPQAVVFSSAGADTVKVVAPNGTERFAGTDGIISLAPTQQKMGQADPALALSGGLSSFIGAARTSNIPASPRDEFVIWPDGRLLLQKRQKNNGTSR